MRYVAEAASEENLIMSKEGPGRLYYRLGMRYAPKDLHLPTATRLHRRRKYEAVDDPDDVVRNAEGGLDEQCRGTGAGPGDHGRARMPLSRGPCRSAARRA